VPANAEMLGLFAGLTRRAAARMVEKLSYYETWSLGYRFSSGPTDTNNTFYRYNYLLPPQGHFWADPFPVRFGDKYFIFFEDYIYKDNKANISVVEIEKGGVVGKPTTVLEKPYHLSYPFTFDWQGARYMIPETGANNTVELYKCKSFPMEWELDRVLLEANNPNDATLVEIEGLWWMFVNIAEPGVSMNWEEVHLYYSTTPLGPWQPHRRNPVKSDVRNSRPAGRLFRRNGELYRPAQDCSRRYGYATSINKVISITPDDYVEEEVSKIRPQWDRRVIGTHTINQIDSLTVIDCLIKRSRFI
jgi:hypothetical protein